MEEGERVQEKELLSFLGAVGALYPANSTSKWLVHLRRTGQDTSEGIQNTKSAAKAKPRIVIFVVPATGSSLFVVPATGSSLRAKALKAGRGTSERVSRFLQGGKGGEKIGGKRQIVDVDIADQRLDRRVKFAKEARQTEAARLPAAAAAAGGGQAEREGRGESCRWEEMSRQTAVPHFKSKTLNDKYLLGDEIGKGAYGRVYKGVDLQNGDFVAIKQVSLENIPPEDLAGIMQEIDLLKNLNHKNIVKYLGSFKTKSHLYIILEYVENGALASIIKPTKFGAFPESLVAVYIAQVLEGLVYLHEQGVIHRDIKGANILTTKEGIVKLADFGVATKLAEADFHTHSVVGTPYWMAPEVIEMSGVSAASDIWSVGCTIIELLTCVPPYYDLQPMPALFRIVQDDHPPLPENASTLLTDFLHQCFRKDGKLRPDAKTLLRHPWIKSSRRQLQHSWRQNGGMKSHMSEHVATVVERTIEEGECDDSMSSTRQDLSMSLPASTVLMTKDPFDDSDSDEDRKGLSSGASVAGPSGGGGGGGGAGGDGPGSVSTRRVPIRLLAARAARPAVSEASEVVGGGGVASGQADTCQSRLKEVGVGGAQKAAAAVGRLSEIPQSNAAVPRTRGDHSRPPPHDDLPGGLSQRDAGSVGSQSARSAGTSTAREGEQEKWAMEGESLSARVRSTNSRAWKEELPGRGSKVEGRELFAKQAAEIRRLVQLLRPDQEEGVILSTCQKLVEIFRDFPEQKSLLITTHGVIPIIEMLDSVNTEVLNAILQVVNQIIKDNVEFQENLCLVGLIPTVMRFASLEFPRAIRMQSAYFVRQMCHTSTLTLQMFVACRGLPVLVQFLEPDYIEYRDMIHTALEGMWRVFELHGPTPRNDFCRLFAKSGVMDKLVQTLQCLNDVVRFAGGGGGRRGSVATDADRGSELGGGGGGGGGGGNGASSVFFSLRKTSAEFTDISILLDDNKENAAAGGGVSPSPRKSTATAADTSVVVGTGTTSPPSRKLGSASAGGEFDISSSGNHSTRVSLSSPTSKRSARVSGGRHSNGMDAAHRMEPPVNVDVAREYLVKVADLLLEFSRGDTVVKTHMCSFSSLHGLFKMLDLLESPILVKILKCINQLTTDPITLEHLQRAGAILHLVPFLKKGDEGPLTMELVTQALTGLCNLCKVNKTRQEHAVSAGIIPHLKHLIQTNSPLKQLAMPLLCDLAHVSRHTRQELWANGCLEFYLDLLKEEQWARTALDSVANWLASETEQKRVEEALLKQESLDKLVTFFKSCCVPSIGNILEPFLKIITKSTKLNKALSTSGLTPLLVSRLEEGDAIVCLNLLKIIRAMYQHHPRPKQMIVEHDLPRKLQLLVEETRDGEIVLVKQMASSLLKALNINTVL
ncbi:hypothetical protein CBR_g38927 [Chara braunii]|uniref:non-specific serine/threonine protein kinase n=1 Tax=Chara braunii TaxID=69332 RepID=A0A388K0S2_CHABU|nr:hypothetical protein CBR_g38927 [Chara braunii]|eukprot:GBG63616.1 hypothetical protein CBR_g38927 [Chara braunii]